jgi:hypothetical protein
MQDSPVVTPVVDPPQPLRGEALVYKLTELTESINKDLVKFFDKEQKAAARRCRKSLSELSQFAKELRKEISDVKSERYPTDKAE